jgi:hypothetical protein
MAFHPILLLYKVEPADYYYSDYYSTVTGTQKPLSNLNEIHRRGEGPSKDRFDAPNITLHTRPKGSFHIVS